MLVKRLRDSIIRLDNRPEVKLSGPLEHLYLYPAKLFDSGHCLAGSLPDECQIDIIK